jgi:hypothetical protein
LTSSVPFLNRIFGQVRHRGVTMPSDGRRHAGATNFFEASARRNSRVFARGALRA